MLKIKQWLGAAGVALAVAAIAQPARADELSDIIKRGELRVAVQTSGPLMSFMDKSGDVYKSQRFETMTVPQIAADAGAREIGQRLFLNTCAQCHGSDAKGGPSFPNLTDGDWLHGGSPEAIMQTITNGRIGMMPPWKSAIDPKTAGDIAQYVRSLSGLTADPVRVLSLIHIFREQVRLSLPRQ